MTYYEAYCVCKSEDELKRAMKRDAEIAVLFGSNPDRLRAIEDAGNKVMSEKGWDNEPRQIHSSRQRPSKAIQR